ncbi:hypothetical protein Tco_1289525, partial [Tanacetum coccineum]
PKSVFEASKYTHLTDAINDEMSALLRNDTWEIVDLPKDRKAIDLGYRWIFLERWRIEAADLKEVGGLMLVDVKFFS